MEIKKWPVIKRETVFSKYGKEMDRYCFVATDCEKVGEPQNTATEVTEVVLMPLDEFRAHLRSGRLTDVTTGYLGLDYLGLL